MTLTYEHVLFNQGSCEYTNLLQKIVNKGVNVNAKDDHEINLFAFSMQKQP